MSSVSSSASSLEDYAARYNAGTTSGAELAQLEKDGLISKSDRRKIIKLAAKLAEAKELTPRQKLRLEVKQKKAQPRKRLTDEERRAKFGDLDQKIEDRYQSAASHVICLGCRKKGHYLKDCPSAKAGLFDGSRGNVSSTTLNVTSSSGNGGSGGLICFNCGSTEHALRACQVPRDPKGVLKFASCFVCKKTGHLSRDCPNNLNGIYAKGGCCHICRQTDHLVKDCPQRTEEDKANWLRQQENEKQRKEDERLGPRVAGLVDGEDERGMNPKHISGDAHIYVDKNSQGHESEEEENGGVFKEKRKLRKHARDYDGNDQREEGRKKRKSQKDKH